MTAATVTQQKPVLRPLEKWEQGYNVTVSPVITNQHHSLSEEALAAAAELLKISPPDLASILSQAIPLPLARAATSEEAQVFLTRLEALGIETRIVPDAVLISQPLVPVRIRKIVLDDAGLTAYQNAGSSGISMSWNGVMLLVVGRLTNRRTEILEQRVKRAENRIIDSSEYFTDEPALDFYVKTQETAFRVTAKSFDFSCLGNSKSLVSEENFSALVRLFRERMPEAICDDSYLQQRRLLEGVWPSEQENASAGWRRNRPGKYSMESSTALSNETQFLKYSRLRYLFYSESSKTNGTS